MSGTVGEVWARLDADAEIGAGHAVRCRALLDAVGPRRRVVVGAVASSLFPADAARAVNAALPDDEAADWLLADHPTDSAAFLDRTPSRSGLRVAIADDARPLPADLVVRGIPSLPVRSERCQGAPFALLRPEFAAARARASAREGVLCVAGSGPRAAAWLLGLGRTLTGRRLAASLRFVVGPTFGAHGELAEQTAALGGSLEVGLDARALAARFSSAALVVTTGGMLSLEALASGAPALVAAVEPEMKEDVAVLDAQGAIRRIDPSDPERSATAIEQLLDDRDAANALGAAGAARVDGRGASRVAACIRERLAEHQTGGSAAR